MPNATSRANVGVSKSPTYGVVMGPQDTATLSGAGVDFNKSGNVGLNLTVNPTTTPSQEFFGRTVSAVSVPSDASPVATTVMNITVPNVTTQFVLEVTAIASEAAGGALFRSSTSYVGVRRTAGAAAVAGASSGGSFNFNVGTAAGSSPSAIAWATSTVTGGVTADNVVPVTMAITTAAPNTFSVTIFWRLMLPSGEAVSIS